MSAILIQALDVMPIVLFHSVRQIAFRHEHAVRRIAPTREQCESLPSFPASDKRKDPRYPWFVANHGKRCWELDALDPNELRDLVEQEIKSLIEPIAWARCETVNSAERESLRYYATSWSEAAIKGKGDHHDEPT
jgi:hypothetical protein